jgi:uncharacterized protein (TIGR00288 family)
MKIALLIDCENADPKSIHGILDELASRGTTNIRRAYGNWKNNGSWEANLHPFGIQPIQQFPYTKGKNALDMCMAIDAMDLLYTEQLDCFALVTSDSDFTPLVLKLFSKGKTVIGFGERKTPEPFKKACMPFIHTDDFHEPTAENPTPQRTIKKTQNELKGDTELMNVLRSAVDNEAEDDSWAHLGRISTYIANNKPSISCKNYGYPKWGSLIQATKYFDEETRNNHLYFRKKRKNANNENPIRPSTE